MKTLRTIFLSAFTGALAALIFQRFFESPRPSQSALTPSPAPSRDSRALDDLSEAYKNRRPRLIDYSEDEIAFHLDALATQLVRPGMTELEAERAGRELSEIVREAINYDAYKKDREKRHKKRAEQWIDQIDEDGGDDDEQSK